MNRDDISNLFPKRSITSLFRNIEELELEDLENRIVSYPRDYISSKKKCKLLLKLQRFNELIESLEKANEICPFLLNIELFMAHNNENKDYEKASNFY